MAVGPSRGDRGDRGVVESAGRKHRGDENEDKEEDRLAHVLAFAMSLCASLGVGAARLQDGCADCSPTVPFS